MAVKDRYIRNITGLLETAGQSANSPAGMRAQQLSREAVVFTFYACFLSPKRLCRASAFDYATMETSTKDDPSVWAAVMVRPQTLWLALKKHLACPPMMYMSCRWIVCCGVVSQEHLSLQTAWQPNGWLAR